MSSSHNIHTKHTQHVLRCVTNSQASMDAILQNLARTGYKNTYDGPLDYEVPAGKVITGMYSIYSDHYC